MTEVEFIAYQIRENRIEYARLKKELMEAIDEQWTKKEWKKVFSSSEIRARGQFSIAEIEKRKKLAQPEKGEQIYGYSKTN